MKFYAILTAAIVTSSVLTYNFLREDIVNEQFQTITSTSDTVASREIQNKIANLSNIIQNNQKNHQEELQKTLSENIRLKELLMSLEARVKSVETADNTQLTEENALKRAKQIADLADSSYISGKNMDEASEYNRNNSKATKSKDDNLIHWMDETLSSGYLDGDSTALAAEQATNNLAKLPGVNLDDMQCSDRFCRATFVQENGKQPDIGELFGEPPFTNEGFTIYEDDGRVSLYFTEPGVSIDELHNEASMAVTGDIDS